MHQVAKNIKTMSSVELVEVINSMREEGRAELRHADFMVKLEKHPGINSPKFSGQYKDSTGRSLKCYHLLKREAELMVMSESLAVQAKVYDRMAELEASAPAKIAAPKRTPDPALSAIRMAKATQLNIESANAICARFPSIGVQGQQVIFSKIVGGDVIPLPLLENRTYTATEVGLKLVASANAIGRLANANNLKTSEFGIFVLDKSKSSDKQVETFRYNDAGVTRLADLLGAAA